MALKVSFNCLFRWRATCFLKENIQKQLTFLCWFRKLLYSDSQGVASRYKEITTTYMKCSSIYAAPS